MSKTPPLPDPLTPVDCDLRGLPYMPLDVVRLIDSDLFALSTGDEFKIAVALWCKAWSQVPAGSLPDDDRILAHLSSAGMGWASVREMALRGWVKCSDGRLYHPVVAEKALVAWKQRQMQRGKAQKRWDRSGGTDTPPDAGIATAQATGHATARKNGAAAPENHATGDAAARPNDATALPLHMQVKVQGSKKVEESSPSSSTKEESLPREEVDDDDSVHRIMPKLSDPPHRWMFLSDPDRPHGATDDRDFPDQTPHPVVAGTYFDKACRQVCEAAGLDNPSWRGDWDTVGKWLRSGFDLDQHIIPIVRSVAARSRSPVRTLFYFDSEIRRPVRRQA